MKTLFLHVGTPKTGTSSIQAFLRNNRERLSPLGYCFPIMPYTYSSISRGRNAHFLIGSAIDYEATEKRKRWHKQRLEEGLNEIHAMFEIFDNVVLSDESLWRALNYVQWNPIKLLKEDGDIYGYDVKVVVYLRRQDSFIFSRWNQMIKKEDLFESFSEHVNHTMEEFPLLLDYEATLDNIAEIIGVGNLIVRRFDPLTWHQQSIYADFMNAIGLDIGDVVFDVPVEEVNVGLKGNNLEIKRIINSIVNYDKFEKRYLGKYIKQLSDNQETKYHSSMFSVEETKVFLDNFAKGNAAVVEKYIKDGKPLFSSEIKELPKWTNNNDYMLEDTIRLFATVTMELHKENEQLRHELQQTNHKIDTIMGSMENLKRNIDNMKYSIKHPVRTMSRKIYKKKDRKNES